MDTAPTMTVEQEVRELVAHVHSIGGGLNIGGNVTRTDVRRVLRGVEAAADAVLILARRIDVLEQQLAAKQ